MVNIKMSGSSAIESSGIGGQLGFLLRQAQAAVWQDLIATLAPFDLRPAQYERAQVLSLPSLTGAARSFRVLVLGCIEAKFCK